MRWLRSSSTNRTIGARGRRGCRSSASTPGAQRQDGLEAGQAVERIGRRLPHEDVAHIGRVEVVAAPVHRVAAAARRAASRPSSPRRDPSGGSAAPPPVYWAVVVVGVTRRAGHRSRGGRGRRGRRCRPWRSALLRAQRASSWSSASHRQPGSSAQPEWPVPLPRRRRFRTGRRIAVGAGALDRGLALGRVRRLGGIAVGRGCLGWLARGFRVLDRLAVGRRRGFGACGRERHRARRQRLRGRRGCWRALRRP